MAFGGEMREERNDRKATVWKTKRNWGIERRTIIQEEEQEDKRDRCVSNRGNEK